MEPNNKHKKIIVSSVSELLYTLREINNIKGGHISTNWLNCNDDNFVLEIPDKMIIIELVNKN